MDGEHRVYRVLANMEKSQDSGGGEKRPLERASQVRTRSIQRIAAGGRDGVRGKSGAREKAGLRAVGEVLAICAVFHVCVSMKP